MTTTKRQMATIAASGVAACAVLYLFFYRPIDGFDYNFGYWYGRDFINFWAAGKLALSGEGRLLTDFDTYNTWLRTQFTADIGPFHNFSYPPHLVPLLLPFGALPYGIALALFTALSALSVWLAVRCALRHQHAGLAACVAVISPGVIATAFQGQLTSLIAALLFVALMLLDRRPVLAGICLGLMSVKPHMGLVVGLLLLVEQRWRAAAAAIVTTAILVAASIALLGVEAWSGFFGVTLAKQAEFMNNMAAGFRYFQVAPYAGFRGIGLPPAVATVLHGATAVALAVGAIAIWLRHTDRLIGAFAVAAASVLATPYANSYDLTLLALPLAASYAVTREPSSLHGAAAALLWLAPALTIPVAIVALPAMPIAVLVASAAALLPVCLSVLWQQRPDERPCQAGQATA
jgi:hypothetical protein